MGPLAANRPGPPIYAPPLAPARSGSRRAHRWAAGAARWVNVMVDRAQLSHCTTWHQPRPISGAPTATIPAGGLRTLARLAGQGHRADSISLRGYGSRASCQRASQAGLRRAQVVRCPCCGAFGRRFGFSSSGVRHVCFVVVAGGFASASGGSGSWGVGVFGLYRSSFSPRLSLPGVSFRAGGLLGAVSGVVAG